MRKKQPISCSDLWVAVTDTLGNGNNYSIVAIDPEARRASFIVVGALFSQSETVRLKEGKSGCNLQVRFGFTGADDEGAFRKRVSRALKIRSAKNQDSGNHEGLE